MLLEYAIHTMTDDQLQQIRGIYGEIAGWLEGLPPEQHPNGFPTVVNGDVIGSYNMEVMRLTQITDVSYSHCQLNRGDSMANSGRSFYTTNVKMKMGALAKRLEQEYGLGQSNNTSAPIVVSVQQNQQVSVSVTPIQQFIDSTDNDDLREALQDLRHTVEVSKDTAETTGILGKIMAMSWEVFIKVLPYVLEHLGKG